MNSSCSHERFNSPLAAHCTRAAAEATLHDYHPELSTPALIAEVRQLLFSQRRAERLVCRYLADLADRVHRRCDGALIAFVDELHAAASFFALGARETRERVRIGRALRRLPLIEAAFATGELSYSRVRELTRVATPATEATWLQQTHHLDMRTLERHVASPSTPHPASRPASHPPSGPAGATRAPSRTQRREPASAPHATDLPSTAAPRATDVPSTAAPRTPTCAPSHAGRHATDLPSTAAPRTPSHAGRHATDLPSTAAPRATDIPSTAAPRATDVPSTAAPRTPTCAPSHAGRHATDRPSTAAPHATDRPSTAAPRTPTCEPETEHRPTHAMSDELSPAHAAEPVAGERAAARDASTPPDRAAPTESTTPAEPAAPCAPSPSMKVSRATTRATPVTATQSTTSDRSRTSARAITEWLPHDAVRVTFELSAEAWALLERALEAAREGARAPLADTEALEAIAHNFLAAEETRQRALEAAREDARAPLADTEALAHHFLAAKNTRELAHEAADPGCPPVSEAVHRTPIHDPEAAGARSTPDCDAAKADSSPASEAADCGRCAAEAVTAPRALTRGTPIATAASSSPVATAAIARAFADEVPAPANPPCGETTPHLGSSRGREALPWILERRSRWTLDELEHETGLSVPDLQYELLLLELSGRIQRPSGWIEPVRAPQARRNHEPLSTLRTKHNPPEPARMTRSSPPLQRHV